MLMVGNVLYVLLQLRLYQQRVLYVHNRNIQLMNIYNFDNIVGNHYHQMHQLVTNGRLQAKLNLQLLNTNQTNILQTTNQ